jgi:hypothetical protein
MSTTIAQPKAQQAATLARYIKHKPKAHRIVLALLGTPFLWREQVDQVAGVSNGPDEIAILRGHGLEIPCQRVPTRDRDGGLSQPGRYSLTEHDRDLVRQGLATVAQGGAA